MTGATGSFGFLCVFDGSDGFVGFVGGGGSVGWFGFEFCVWGLVRCRGRSPWGVVCMCWGIGFSVGDSVVVGWESVALEGEWCVCCCSLRIRYGSV